jgi:hypothetical protein
MDRTSYGCGGTSDGPTRPTGQRVRVTVHSLIQVQQGFSQFGPTELIHIPKKE